MALITRYPIYRHLRGEPTFQTLLYRNGKLVRSGRGLSFWYRPLKAGLAEVPLDDRELPFLFHGRSADFQDVVAQGVITYRVVDPEILATRVDFTLNPQTGEWTQQPLEKVGGLLTQLAQQSAWEYLTHAPVHELLTDGVAEIRRRIGEALAADARLQSMGIEVASVRVASVRPDAEVERALQMPTREEIQQEADEATFQRRALAVEKERAIAENELQNRIELAKREELLVAQEGANRRRSAEEESEALRIESEAAAARTALESETRAGGIRVVGDAAAEAEGKKIGVYREIPTQVLLGLAARELAGKLGKIEHLTLTPELLTPLLQNLLAMTQPASGNGKEG
jgi:regulator of protease activity HflC (stomatin/prohibitin superfamily)